MPSASFRRSSLTCKVVSLQLKHFLMSCYDKYNQDCYSFDCVGLLLGHFAPDRQIPPQAAKGVCATVLWPPLEMHRPCQSKIPNWRLSIFTRPQKPLRVACCWGCCCCCCCYHHGRDDYCSFHCQQPAPGRPGHGAGDSNYVIWAVWGHILHDIMISWSPRRANTLLFKVGKDDFIFKYCCNTLGRRRRASMACEYHKTTADPLASAFFFFLPFFALSFPLGFLISGKIDAFDSKRQIQPVLI